MSILPGSSSSSLRITSLPHGHHMHTPKISHLHYIGFTFIYHLQQNLPVSIFKLHPRTIQISSHIENHMLSTWVSHARLTKYHMLTTWVSHAHFSNITCSPHGYHMHTSQNITCSPHGYHMHTSQNITCLPHGHHMHTSQISHGYHMHNSQISHAHYMGITFISFGKMRKLTDFHFQTPCQHNRD